MSDAKQTVRLLPLREQPALAEKAAAWFASKWSVPIEAYRQSMADCLAGKTVPQWYLLTDVDGNIAGGAGVIENDFHDRPDLAPNLCALYVEPAWRGCGLAGMLLDGIRADMAAQGIETLYLVTDHTAFYERHGWRFLTVVRCDDGCQSRLYTAQTLLKSEPDSK